MSAPLDVKGLRLDNMNPDAEESSIEACIHTLTLEYKLWNAL